MDYNNKIKLLFKFKYLFNIIKINKNTAVNNKLLLIIKLLSIYLINHFI